MGDMDFGSRVMCVQRDISDMVPERGTGWKMPGRIATMSSCAVPHLFVTQFSSIAACYSCAFTLAFE